MHKDKLTLQERLKVSKQIAQKNPGNIGLIIQRSQRCRYLPQLKKNCFMVSKDTCFRQVLMIVRKKLNQVQPQKSLAQYSIIVYADKIIPGQSAQIGQLWQKYKSLEDHLLHLKYTSQEAM